MSKLLDIIDNDNHNFRQAHEALLKLSPTSLDIVEDGYSLWASVPRLLGETDLYDNYQKSIYDWAKSFGLRGKEALDLLQNAVLIGTPPPEDFTTKAKESLSLGISFVIRMALALRIQRDYLVGFAELLRLRSFTAFSLLRLQSETAALILYMHKHPDVAKEWLGTFDESKGIAFHRNHSRSITEIIRSLKLYKEYSEASGISQHSRFWGVAPGILLTRKYHPHPFSLGLASIDIDDPTILLQWFCRMLSFYAKLLDCLEIIFPDVDESIFGSLNRPSFTKAVDDLWVIFRKRYSKLRGKIL